MKTRFVIKSFVKARVERH